MKKITRWSPHVCNCVVDYEWDTEVSESERRHIVVNHEHCGQDHPHAIVGEQLEGSIFHEDFKKRDLIRLKAEEQ